MTDTLINKYRPQTFDEVIGQDEVISALQRIVNKKTSHTFLFIGPSGVGKTTLARILTKEFDCSLVKEVDAATYTSIENMRELIDLTKHRLFGSHKIGIIIDEVHALSKAALQSLLKSLEEPNDDVYWILCTTEPQKILDTIKTRCSVFNLKTVSRSVLKELLSTINKSEGFDLPNDILSICVEKANGSPRQAISNLGICLNTKNRVEAATLLNTELGSEIAFEFAKALAKNQDWDSLKNIIARMSDQNPESIRQVVKKYFTNAVLKSEKTNLFHLEILEQFSQPFNYYEGITPVLLATARLKLTE